MAGDVPFVYNGLIVRVPTQDGTGQPVVAKNFVVTQFGFDEKSGVLTLDLVEQEGQ